ncbi:MAG: AmmeMemoRadiSam system protein A [Myxococcales bacterium]|nr:AmmeMemoRadiSam system protein A [Myxococcales bacterium]
MSSPDERLFAPHASGLLELAQRSIRHGLDQGCPLDVDPSEYAPELRAPRATFVTLRCANALRGCTGSLEARRALVVDIAHNAYGSAFADPRFAALTHAELEGLELHLSILSELEPLQVASEAELIAQLRPKVDGLVLREGHRVGTYLPAVWDTLPDARLFLRDLKKKAGLPEDYWSSTLELSRYTVTTLS